MLRDFLGGLYVVSILVVGMMLEGCVSGKLQLGLGQERHSRWGDEPSSVIRVQGVTNENLLTEGDRLILEWDHHSSVPNGPPFNRKDETTADQFSIVYEVPLWGKR